MIEQKDLLKVLDELELLESKLLSWGDTGAYFTYDELKKIISRCLPHLDVEDVEDELRRTVMVVPVTDARDREIGVRSRMAEAMYLFRSLRQWMNGDNLSKSRTLVSDYRFVRRPRMYPRRDLEVSNLIDNWTTKISLDKSTINHIRHLVGEYRLSGFQSRATELILERWKKHSRKFKDSSGTIISAGTGSGKTLAFYLPALSSLASDISKNTTKSSVRILAIYPRKELLKDQFNETWMNARKLDNVQSDIGGRKIKIGAFFGDTPTSNRYALKGKSQYLNYNILQCQDSNCRGEMRWSKKNIDAGRERLECHLCGHAVSDDEVGLTRQSLAINPPDILFTTIEMLNQRMSDPRHRHLFGVGVSDPVSLVLLDEVHTYSGSTGAQTSLLLKRWMKLSGNRPHYVGLSATLRDAANFFSTLTGTKQSCLLYTSPSPRDLSTSRMPSSA